MFAGPRVPQEPAAKPPDRVEKERRAKPRRKQMSKGKMDVSSLEPVLPEEVEGDVLHEFVLGKTGDEYHGYPVVVLKRVPGVFGCPIKREHLKKYTLHEGFVNQADMAEPPAPYWAVMEAMFKLRKGFTRDQVVSRAVETISRCYPPPAFNREACEKACHIALDVLRNHQNHATKRAVGMGFVVDVLEDKKTMVCRARDADETYQYFEAARGRRKASKGTTVMAGQKKAKPDEVPEERPAIVLRHVEDVSTVPPRGEPEVLVVPQAPVEEVVPPPSEEAEPLGVSLGLPAVAPSDLAALLPASGDD